MGTQSKTGALPYVKPLLNSVKVESSHKFCKPGDILTFKGVRYEAVEGKKCKDCAFYHPDSCCTKPASFNECCGYSRPDQTWIIFKKK